MEYLGERVYTIDPATARDLDDAIHIKLLHDGTYEVAHSTSEASYTNSIHIKLLHAGTYEVAAATSPTYAHVCSRLLYALAVHIADVC